MSDWRVKLGHGGFTITGTGFGSRTSLTPLFHQFFAPGDIVNDDPVTNYGYDDSPVSGAPVVRMKTTDGYVSGYGRLSWQNNSDPAPDNSFPRLYVTLPNESAKVFTSYVFRIARVSGSDNSAGTFQLKATRVSTLANYNGSPLVGISHHFPHNPTSYGYTQKYCYRNDARTDIVGTSDAGETGAYATGYNAGGWNLVEDYIDYGSVNTANGKCREWINGNVVDIPNYSGWDEEAILVRDEATYGTVPLIRTVMLHPGLTAFMNGNVYQIDVAEHVVDTTQARVVIGNASTWSACTQRQYMLPTSWSDTQVTASWRPLAFASSGQTVYGYVVNDSGTVSAATSLVVP